jgi:hypothetical protein
MRILEGFGIGVLILLCLLIVIFARREIISRGGGTIDLSLRLTSRVRGRGWSAGVARYAGDQLRWYRVFSLAPRPRRTLHRSELSVRGRRLPDPAEQYVMPAGWVVVSCTHRGSVVEIAMAEAALTGFLSWMEAAPPGAVSPRLAVN